MATPNPAPLAPVPQIPERGRQVYDVDLAYNPRVEGPSSDASDYAGGTASSQSARVGFAQGASYGSAGCGCCAACSCTGSCS